VINHAAKAPTQGCIDHRFLVALAHHAIAVLRDYLYIPLGGNTPS
jgi:hypothetical protein